ncbi:NADPH-dependent FMN reductase [Nocardioides alkalitolerans]|uniref:NADPH-dependent FMN reductase n=1 Tax=Nocardioides alkalitolerans TaxID=281714 RepID=UPI00248020AB|nr:NAD(P)H-dependent oxidoreductase [Nocardioides alkalitolerans]
MSLRVSIVVGNPKPQSRTLRFAELLVSKLLAPGAYTVDVVDLADYADEVLVWPSEKLQAINQSVAESDLVVVASPTYKATYTGLLKAFLDRYPANGLAGVTAIPLHTGADLGHQMGPTFTLAPLLSELGAVIPGRGLYIALSQLDKLEEVVEAAAAEYSRNLDRLARVAAATALPRA